jgi:hypothetical protein
MKRLVLTLAVPAALAACSGHQGDSSAPWLTEPTLATHSARFFPIGVGSVHGPPAGQPLTTCNQCHADRSTGVVPPPPAASFKTFTCTGCHVEVQPGVFHDDIAGLATLSFHQGQPVFDATQPAVYDQACFGCHPGGTATAPAYHGQLFPVAAGSAHAGIGCAQCHGAVRSDIASMQCASCHAGLAGFSTAHDPVSVTGSGRQVAITVHVDPVGTGTCTPQPLASIQSPDCLLCHARSAHLDAATLAASHTNSLGRSILDQDPHGRGGCETCHVSTTQVTVAVSPPPAGYPTLDFAHQPGSSPSQSTTGCATCHQHGCGGNGN